MSRELAELIRDLRAQPDHKQRLACGYGAHVWSLNVPGAGLKRCSRPECGATYTMSWEPSPVDVSLDDVALLHAHVHRLVRELDEANARIADLVAEVEWLRLLPKPRGWDEGAYTTASPGGRCG